MALHPRHPFLALGLSLLVSSCVIVDRPLLGLRSIAGGIHNRRQVSGLDAFFFADGRMGLAANGALLVEREPGGVRVRLADMFADIDDVAPSPDGLGVVFVSGREQITAGGGHNDHVFQLYLMELATGAWRRLGTSRRAELLPCFTADGRRVVFARRAEYAGWSLDNPWGPASLFVIDVDGSNERRLTEPLAYPLLGLQLVDGDRTILYGARDDAGVANVYAVDFPEGGSPRLLVPNAFLPTALPEGARGEDGAHFLVARTVRDEDGGASFSLARCALDGTVLSERELSPFEPLSIAPSPDGNEVLWSDFDPDLGQFGRYRLRSLPKGSRVSIELETLEYRNPERYKPLDVIRPLSWWFRDGASPGSR